MPVNTYEGMFLLDSTKVAASWDDSVRHVHDILNKHESEIVASRQWDERRLAYPVEGHKKGTYLLTYFKTEGAQLKEIVADCHLSDVVIRELILKVHPKLVDHLVTQAMTSNPNAEAEEATSRGGGRPPPPPPPRRVTAHARRAPRRSAADSPRTIHAGVGPPGLSLVTVWGVWYRSVGNNCLRPNAGMRQDAAAPVRGRERRWPT